MSDADFSLLLHAAEQLATDVEGNEELPRVERSLGQVLEASQELYSKVTQTGAHDIQANLLLGSKGIDLPQISQKLETLSARRTFEPLQPIADSDIESFLRNERENAILSLIDDVNKSSIQTIEEHKWEHMVSEWNQEKIKLMNALIGTSQNWLDLKSMPETSIPTGAIKKIGPSMLDNQEMAYAKLVHNHNKIVMQGSKRPSLIQKFAAVADEFNDQKIKEMWGMIKAVSNNLPIVNKDDPLKCRSTPVMQKALISHALNYLQQGYKTYMKNIVMDNLQNAQRGGVPGTYPLVRGFVTLRMQGQSLFGLSDGQIDGRPLWPMVYYCLRSGDLEAALQCIKLAGPGFEDFIDILEELIKNPGNPLSNKLQTTINFQYRRNIRNATDPYKRIVYCVLGCCDVNDEHPDVAKTADDYLWLKLSLIRVDNVSNDNESMSYQDLQKNILEEYGETHYRAYEQPVVYFQLLTLTGQFEPALEFLSRISKYQVHAVHMAIALNESYLLAGPRTVQAPLISIDIEDPVPMRRLNLARLILLYVRRFEVTDPAEALQYFYFLRNMKDINGKNLFMVCVSDLALECRDYDTLFGRIDPMNGMKTKGLVDLFNSSFIDCKLIAANVADELVKKGLFEDAINMYDISGNTEKVFEICCMLLSQVVSETKRSGSLRERLTQVCNNLRNRHTNTPLPSQIQQSFDILNKLIIFFDEYHCKNYVGALEALNACKIVPLSPEEEHEYVTTFKRLSGEVCKVMPDILLATMTILYNKYQNQKSPDQMTHMTTEGKDRQIQFLREQAEIITSFAGNIPFRMPGDVYSQLTQMQILMH